MVFNSGNFYVTHSMNFLKQIIPSFLSTLRLIAALAFPFCPESFWGWLILGAGTTDILDGWLARRWKVESWQGGLIDAIADKLFVLAVLAVFVTRAKFSFLWFPLVISRDILVAFTAIYVAAIRRWDAFKKMGARASGKLATAGQFVLFMTVILTSDNVFPALIFASFCSLAAAIDYGMVFSRAFAAHSRETG